MQNTKYISSPVQKKLSLAEKTWEYFSPFLCRYQWAFDEPSNSPRKSEIAHAILNCGKPGCCTFARPDGYTCRLQLLHAWAFAKAITNQRKIYYVSYGRQALLYFDVDLHYEWQTLKDGQEAKEKLNGFFTKYFGQPVLFWSPSSRGFNGYLKVDLDGMEYARANKIFDRLEDNLERFLAYCENLANFEIKGKIGFMQDNGKYHWAQYGKLPIHDPDWNFSKLEEFNATPAVSIHRLGSMCKMIETQVPLNVLERHNENKKGKGNEPISENGYFLVTPAIEKALVDKHGEGWRYMFAFSKGEGDDMWLAERYHRPGKTPVTEIELRKEKNDKGHLPQTDSIAECDWGTLRSGTRKQPEYQPRIAETGAAPEQDDKRDVRVSGPVAHQRGPVNLDFSDLISEPDSFKRQKEALFRYARYLKRMPTLEEGMQLIHDHHLFTGDWEDNLGRRRDRVQSILDFMAQSFDPSKCGNGSVNVGKYDSWVAKKFPHGLTGRTRGRMNEDGQIIDGQQIHVGPRFIAVFMAVAEFALVIDKNQDDSLPHNRAQELWEALLAKGLISVKFDARKWAICREGLIKHGIIAITDRDYHTGKAMKWSAGRFFPFLGLWKSPKLRSPGGSPLRKKIIITTEQQHNTLLQWQSQRTEMEAPLMPARPPPWTELAHHK